MIEVEIGGGQKLKIPEQIINYYASVPNDAQENDLIESVLIDQDSGLLENSRQGQLHTMNPITHDNSNAHRNRDIWDPRNHMEQPQQHWQCERDLSKIISAWKLTFTGSKSENIEEFLLRVKEHRKIAVLSDAELLRAMPMLLQLPAPNYYRNNEHKWKSWSQIEQALREQYRDEFYAERLEEKVKERKQREDEPVFEYIAEMQALYKKMSLPPEENKQIRQIYINMRPEYLPLMRSHLHSNLEKFTEYAMELGRAFDAGKQNATNTTANKPHTAAIEVPTRDELTKIMTRELNKLKESLKSTISSQITVQLANLSESKTSANQETQNAQNNTNNNGGNSAYGHRGYNRGGSYSRGRGRGRGANSYSYYNNRPPQNGQNITPIINCDNANFTQNGQTVFASNNQPQEYNVTPGFNLNNAWPPITNFGTGSCPQNNIYNSAPNYEFPGYNGQNFVPSVSSAPLYHQQTNGQPGNKTITDQTAVVEDTGEIFKITITLTRTPIMYSKHRTTHKSRSNKAR